VERAAGTITFWPRRFAGGIVVGPRRIALDVSFQRGRLVLDGEVGPPPYLTGITLPGRLSGGSGVSGGTRVSGGSGVLSAFGVSDKSSSSDIDVIRDSTGAEVKVRIHPAQLLELWFRLNL
jgi:hypothetical protein